MKHLYGKNRPAPGIPARRDGTKNVPPPYKQYVIKTIETYTCRDPGHRPVLVNVPSRLSYKQALTGWRKNCLTLTTHIAEIDLFFRAESGKRVYDRPHIYL